MTTVVITANLPSGDTPNVHCTPESARTGLAYLIEHHAPKVIGLQEFGIEPRHPGYHFSKAHPCIGIREDDPAIYREHKIILAKGRQVEPEKGRRLILPDCPAVILIEIPKDASLPINLTSNTHLPAHVEIRGLYRKIKDHLTGRSAMHRQARHAWREDAHRRVRDLEREFPGRKVNVWLTADPNFSLMKLLGFISCWANHHLKPTFGPRTIDSIWSTVRALSVTTIKIPSDHHAVKATYR